MRTFTKKEIDNIICSTFDEEDGSSMAGGIFARTAYSIGYFQALSVLKDKFKENE